MENNFFCHCEPRTRGVKQSLVKIHVRAVEPEIAASPVRQSAEQAPRNDKFNMPKEKLKLGQYQHFKGSKYEVIGQAKHTETGEELVIYQDVNDKNKIWARPLAMFLEEVEVDGKKVPRFKLL